MARKEFMNDKKRALEVAKILIETESVLINTKKPFTFTSGKQAPVYVDCRRLISFPSERTVLMDMAASVLREKIGIKNIDFVAGGETAGIPYAAFVAERLDKPMLYVRKKPKGFGRMAQIEGNLPNEDKNVVLIEDLQTDGGSKKVFIDALREAGANINHTLVIFHYGIYKASENNMKSMGLTLHALTTWWDVLAYIKDNSVFDGETVENLENYLKNPESWAP